MCRFFGFKSCTIMTFMILLKRYVWEKSGSQVKSNNALGQLDCRIFKLNISKTIGGMKLIFCMQVHI